MADKKDGANDHVPHGWTVRLTHPPQPDIRIDPETGEVEPSPFARALAAKNVTPTTAPAAKEL